MQFTCLITAKLRHSRKIIVCSGCVHDDGGVKPERTYIDRKTDISYDTSVKKNISKTQLITMFQH